MTFSQPLNYQLKRNKLKQTRNALFKAFKSGSSVSELINNFSEFIDQLLCEQWHESGLDLEENICLIALGGYGRKEMHLYSDVDLLCLIPEDPSRELFSKLEIFIRGLWDIGIEIGHSTRSLTQCILDAKKDVSFLTTLIEARLLIGNNTLYDKLISATSMSHIWPSNKFFQVKWKEQLVRYKKYSGTAYNLEPNIKYGPGGLRDIQMVYWLVKRHLQSGELAELVTHDFLTKEEYQTLIEAQTYLWKIRFALHYHAGKREERLLFEYQTQFAKLFNYHDDKKIAVEEFMHDYYRAVNTIQALNDMLLQLFREAILNKDKLTITPINAKFELRNAYLSVKNPTLFKQDPASMLELFLTLSQRPEIKGVSASTIRLLRQANHLIDERFRQSPVNNRLFLSLLHQNSPIAKQLQRMKRYGILGQFIPEFGEIIGQMQHDLFHVYTVDEHTLILVQNLNRFTDSKRSHIFPLCNAIMSKIKKQALLYIAALFHDIGKGRGGDHSKLGGEYVRNFGQRLKLKQEDIKLITWLVKNHLLMSHTAQRKDIFDPYTIHIFANQVNNISRLNYLYLLTVADICATNPNLWNSWRDTLLKELYFKTLNYLEQDFVDEKKIIQNNKSRALSRLRKKHIDVEKIHTLWAYISDSYFLSEHVNTIVNHSVAILHHKMPTKPLLLPLAHGAKDITEIFIYMPIHENSFTITTTILANYHLNILEARTYRTSNNFSLESYIVLDTQHRITVKSVLLEQIQTNLFKYLTYAIQLPVLKQIRVTREKQYFSTPTKIQFQMDEKRNRTILFIITADRPGLLARISKAFLVCNIRLHRAKIATAGERAEDVFYITNQAGMPITHQAEQASIAQTIRRHLTYKY